MVQVTQIRKIEIIQNFYSETQERKVFKEVKYISYDVYDEGVLVYSEKVKPEMEASPELNAFVKWLQGKKVQLPKSTHLHLNKPLIEKLEITVPCLCCHQEQAHLDNLKQVENLQQLVEASLLRCLSKIVQDGVVENKEDSP
jgi:hypothetical protein